MKANSEIDCLKSDVAGKGRIIQQYVVIKELEREYDDVEQNGRNGFFRIFGVPENTNWDTDSKVIHVFNEIMKMDPPIDMEDMEVTHRVGKPSLFSGQIDQPTPAAQPVSHGEAAEVPTASALPSGEVTQASRESSSRDDWRVLPDPY